MDQQYSLDEYGVLHELKYKLIKYDPKYVTDRYDALPDRGMKMSYLRLGALFQITGSGIGNVLDVGYGNGSFLDACASVGMRTYGFDVSGYELENKAHKLIHDPWDRIKPFDVVTFFDSLEHIPDLYFLHRLRTKYVMVSVPWYHPEKGQEWFENWKHRRPGEHLHHFSRTAIQALFRHYGFRTLSISNLEDCFRPPENKFTPNIMTCIFEKIGF